MKNKRKQIIFLCKLLNLIKSFYIDKIFLKTIVTEKHYRCNRGFFLKHK